MTTQEQRAAWRELAAAATPGEWTAAEAWNGDESYYVFVKDGRALLDTYVSLSDADAAFIAAARAAVPQLLADVDALQAERDAARAEVMICHGLLESLTPGGSEFSGWPERCAAWVQERLSTTAKIAGERNELRRERDALAAELASYKRQAAYISSVIDSEGKYVP